MPIGTKSTCKVCLCLQIKVEHDSESSDSGESGDLSLLTESEDSEVEGDNRDGARDAGGDAVNEVDDPNMDDSNQDEMRKLFKRRRNMSSLLHLLTVRPRETCRVNLC